VAVRRSKKKSTRSKAHREFVSEAEEILECMGEGLANLQDQCSGGGEADPDLVNGIFRSAHSLKGLAGMFGFDGIGELAHHLEDILDGLRLGRIRFDSPALSLLDEAVALFATLLAEVGTGSVDAGVAQRVADLTNRIESATHEPVSQDDDLSALALSPSLLRALTEYEEHRLRESLRRGRHLALVDSTFDIAAFEEGLAELSTAIREVGEVVSTLPSPGDAPESQIRFSLLVATEISSSDLAARLDFPDTRVRAVGKASPAQPEGQPSAPAARDGGSPDEAGHQGPAPASSAVADSVVAGAGDIESLRSISDTVRVDIRKLDELMNLVGELVIQKGAIVQIANRLAGDSATARVGAELSKAHKQLDRKLKDLQEGVLDVRMVPLRQVFEKLSRVVRRLRRDTEKNVHLEFKGADTELDKLIVEQLVDPLMHVVRNAFDHAIETPEERSAAGKSSEGAIRIEAFQRGNHVVIEVVDDGRGMDPRKIRAAAVARGLLPEDTMLSDKECLDLVFTAGLSTRDEVSETSGRGVGMDVVRSNLGAMGGIVDIRSVLGRGSTVAMTLPITLAIIQALIVGVGKQRFAIPLNSVLETLLAESDAIQHSHGRELLNLRGDPLVLRRLSEEFELPAAERDTKQYVVVLGLGELRMGLLVDRLEGQQDTVIKSINGPANRVRGIAGATEVGDQGAILVIDVASIVEDSIRRRDAA